MPVSLFACIIPECKDAVEGDMYFGSNGTGDKDMVQLRLLNN